MTECVECGCNTELMSVDVVDGDHYCSQCSPITNCKRCGKSTRETTLEGDPLCEHCQEKKREQDTTREVEQEGLDAF